MPSAQRREIAQAGSASSVVSHGVVSVAACRGPSAAGIGTGGMPDLNQVAQPRRGPVRSRLPGMITVAARQEREAEGPRLAGCAGLRFTGRASSRSVTWAVRWAVCWSVAWAVCRSVTWAALVSVLSPGLSAGPSRGLSAGLSPGLPAGPPREPVPCAPGGPARAHPWATGRPCESVSVRHHLVPDRPDRTSAMARESSASSGPYPATLPGASDRPSQLAKGIVRFTLPVGTPRLPNAPGHAAGRNQATWG